jgi:riboflavin kinase/FMN adenylyltransferase
MNIGLRPTLRQPQPRLQIEAHFLELDTDLYGERLDVEFIAKLRSERKFPNLETLTEQIHADINMAKECF